MCTSRIYGRSEISFRCGKVHPALIYMDLGLCNVYFTYLRSVRDLFPLRKSASGAHIYGSQSVQCVLHVSTVGQRSLSVAEKCIRRSYIWISVCAICTSRIYGRSEISFRCGKVHPALIYMDLGLCNVYFTYLRSVRDLFPLRKSASGAHIYGSRSVQCVLHVSTVGQRSLSVAEKCIRSSYIWISVCAMCTSGIYGRSEISFRCGKVHPELIYMDLGLCNVYFRYLRSVRDLFPLRKSASGAHIYGSRSVQCVLQVSTVGQRSLSVAEKCIRRSYIWISVCAMCTSGIYGRSEISFRCGKVHPELIYMDLGLCNVYFRYLRSVRDLFPLRKSASGAHIYGSRSVQCVLQVSTVGQRSLSVAEKCIRSSYIWISVCAMCTSGIYGRSEISFRCGKVHPELIYMDLGLCNVYFRYLRSVRDLFPLRKSASGAHIYGSRSVQCVLQVSTVGQRSLSVAEKCIRSSYIWISVCAMCTSGIYGRSEISFRCGKVHPELIYMDLGLCNVYFRYLRSVRDLFPLRKSASGAHIYGSRSVQCVLQVSTVGQRSLSVAEKCIRRSYIWISVCAMCTSGIYGRSEISFRCGKVHPELIYMDLGLCNVYFRYLRSVRDLFPLRKSASGAHIYGSRSVQCVLQVSTVGHEISFRCGKVHPALIYMDLGLCNVYFRYLRSVRDLFPLRKSASGAHIYGSRSVQCVLQVSTVGQRSLSVAEKCIRRSYIWISVCAMCTSGIYGRSEISFRCGKVHPALIYMDLGLCNVYFRYLRSVRDLFPLRKSASGAHIYGSRSVQCVLHVSTVGQRSLSVAEKCIRSSYIWISVCAMCTSGIYGRSEISFRCGKVHPALIYMDLGLCNVYFRYLRSVRDLFPLRKSASGAHIYGSRSVQCVLQVSTVCQRSLSVAEKCIRSSYIWISVCAMCTSGIYGRSEISFRCGKVHPALIYMDLGLCNVYFRYLRSVRDLFPLRKSASGAHIYGSRSVQCVLQVSTVGQRSLSVAEKCIRRSYIWISVCAMCTSGIYGRSEISFRCGKVHPALIYMDLGLCNVYFRYLRSVRDLFPLRKSASGAHIYGSRSVQCVLQVSTVGQRSLSVAEKCIRRSYIWISVCAMCTSRIYGRSEISFRCGKVHPALIYMDLGLCNVYFRYLRSVRDLFPLRKSASGAHIYGSRSVQCVLQVSTVGQRSLSVAEKCIRRSYIWISVCAMCTSGIYGRRSLSVAEKCIRRSYIWISVCAMCTSGIYGRSEISFRCGKVHPELIYMDLGLCNVYFRYLRSVRDLFPLRKSASGAHIYGSRSVQCVLQVSTVGQRSLSVAEKCIRSSYIWISVCAMCTSRIYGRSEISFRCGKVHPELIYMDLGLCNVYFRYLRSVRDLFPLRKSASGAHIYGSRSVQCVLQVSTVGQRSLSVAEKCIRRSYIWISVCAMCTSGIYGRSEISFRCGKVHPALIYMDLGLCNVYFRYLRSVRDLFPLRKSASGAHIYGSRSVQCVLQVSTVGQRSLSVAEKCIRRSYIWISVCAMCTSGIYGRSEISFRCGKVHPELIYMDLGLCNVYFRYLRSVRDLFPLRKSASGAHIYGSRSVQCVLQVSTVGQRSLSVAEKCIRRSYIWISVCAMCTSGIYGRSEISFRCGKVHPALIYMDLGLCNVYFRYLRSVRDLFPLRKSASGAHIYGSRSVQCVLQVSTVGQRSLSVAEKCIRRSYIWISVCAMCTSGIYGRSEISFRGKVAEKCIRRSYIWISVCAMCTSGIYGRSEISFRCGKVHPALIYMDLGLCNVYFRYLRSVRDLFPLRKSASGAHIYGSRSVQCVLQVSTVGQRSLSVAEKCIRRSYIWISVCAMCTSGIYGRSEISFRCGKVHPALIYMDLGLCNVYFRYLRSVRDLFPLRKSASGAHIYGSRSVQCVLQVSTVGQRSLSVAEKCIRRSYIWISVCAMCTSGIYGRSEISFRCGKVHPALIYMDLGLCNVYFRYLRSVRDLFPLRKSASGAHIYGSRSVQCVLQVSTVGQRSLSVAEKCIRRSYIWISVCAMCTSGIYGRSEISFRCGKVHPALIYMDLGLCNVYFRYLRSVRDLFPLRKSASGAHIYGSRSVQCVLQVSTVGQRSLSVAEKCIRRSYIWISVCAMCTSGIYGRSEISFRCGKVHPALIYMDLGLCNVYFRYLRSVRDLFPLRKSASGAHIYGSRSVQCVLQVSTVGQRSLSVAEKCIRRSYIWISVCAMCTSGIYGRSEISFRCGKVHPALIYMDLGLCNVYFRYLRSVRDLFPLRKSASGAHIYGSRSVQCVLQVSTVGQRSLSVAEKCIRSSYIWISVCAMCTSGIYGRSEISFRCGKVHPALIYMDLGLCNVYFRYLRSVRDLFPLRKSASGAHIYGSRSVQCVLQVSTVGQRSLSVAEKCIRRSYIWISVCAMCTSGIYGRSEISFRCGKVHPALIYMDLGLCNVYFRYLRSVRDLFPLRKSASGAHIYGSRSVQCVLQVSTVGQRSLSVAEKCIRSSYIWISVCAMCTSGIYGRSEISFRCGKVHPALIYMDLGLCNVYFRYLRSVRDLFPLRKSASGAHIYGSRSVQCVLQVSTVGQRSLSVAEKCIRRSYIWISVCAMCTSGIYGRSEISFRCGKVHPALIYMDLGLCNVYFRYLRSVRDLFPLRKSASGAHIYGSRSVQCVLQVSTVGQRSLSVAEKCIRSSYIWISVCAMCTSGIYGRSEISFRCGKVHPELIYMDLGLCNVYFRYLRSVRDLFPLRKSASGAHIYGSRSVQCVLQVSTVGQRSLSVAEKCIRRSYIWISVCAMCTSGIYGRSEISFRCGKVHPELIYMDLGLCNVYFRYLRSVRDLFPLRKSASGAHIYGSRSVQCVLQVSTVGQRSLSVAEKCIRSSYIWISVCAMCTSGIYGRSEISFRCGKVHPELIYMDLGLCNVYFRYLRSVRDLFPLRKSASGAHIYGSRSVQCVLQVSTVGQRSLSVAEKCIRSSYIWISVCAMCTSGIYGRSEISFRCGKVHPELIYMDLGLCNVYFRYLRSVRDLFPLRKSASGAHIYGSRSVQCVLQVSTVGQRSLSVAEKCIRRSYIWISVCAMCTSGIYGRSEISFRCGKVHPELIYMDLGLCNVYFKYLRSVRDLFPLRKSASGAHIYGSRSVQCVLQVSTVGQRSLSVAEKCIRSSYIWISVCAMCTSGIYGRSEISFPCGKVHPELIYMDLGLCNVYFRYLRSVRDLFPLPKSASGAHIYGSRSVQCELQVSTVGQRSLSVAEKCIRRSYIWISVCAMCTSGIYGRSEISFRCGKVHPALIYMDLGLCNVYFRYLRSVRDLFPLLKSASGAHIYGSRSVQCVLQVSTVGQRSLSVAEKCIRSSYIWISVCAMCTSGIYSRSEISFRCGKVHPELIYMDLGLCNVYFRYLRSVRDLFPLRKSASGAHIYGSRSVQCVL